MKSHEAAVRLLGELPEGNALGQLRRAGITRLKRIYFKPESRKDIRSLLYLDPPHGLVIGLSAYGGFAEWTHQIGYQYGRTLSLMPGRYITVLRPGWTESYGLSGTKEELDRFYNYFGELWLNDGGNRSEILDILEKSTDDWIDLPP
ncbi:hypothetical protein KW797_01200 [Candidatus Parcubacteria bacterium]|nr:hypothetical protein [Candidatus Parcubacteria bacterium]